MAKLLKYERGFKNAIKENLRSHVRKYNIKKDIPYIFKYLFNTTKVYIYIKKMVCSPNLVNNIKIFFTVKYI